MFKVSIDPQSLAQLTQRLNEAERNQLPFALSLALNLTGQRVKAAIKEEMGRAFDRPTPYTLNAMQLFPSSKARLEAEVGLKAGVSGRAIRYLGPEIFGGRRQEKGFERALKRRGVMLPELFTVPAQGAPLDRYGNLPGSLITQMLSSLGALTDVYAHQTKRSMRRHKTPSEYFLMTKAGGTKPYGLSRKRGNILQPIIYFIQPPSYENRLHFYELSQEITKSELPKQFEIAMKRALATSKI